MKTEFMQIIFNKIMLDRLTTSLSFLRKEKMSDEALEGAERSLKRNDIFNAFKNSCQDPEEIKQMALNAFDEATTKMRANLASVWDQIIPRLSKKE